MRLDAMWDKVIREFPRAHVMLRYDPLRRPHVVDMHTGTREAVYSYTAVIDLGAGLESTFRRDGETASGALQSAYDAARAWVPLPAERAT